MSADFTCIPCAGAQCFRLPMVERRACSQFRHDCPSKHKAPDDDWQCRCCDACAKACEEN